MYQKHIKTNSWWCRNPAPAEINSVHKDFFAACYIYLPYQPCRISKTITSMYTEKRIQPRHRFCVCPRLPKQHDSAFQNKKKKGKTSSSPERYGWKSRHLQVVVWIILGVFPNLHWGSTTGHHHPWHLWRRVTSTAKWWCRGPGHSASRVANLSGVTTCLL